MIKNSRSDFEAAGFWGLIASVLGLCIPLPLNYRKILKMRHVIRATCLYAIDCDFYSCNYWQFSDEKL